MRSEEQNNASRENGAKSQGPVTPEGKERVSQNARKHGLTSPLNLVAEEDEPAYDHLLAAIFQYYNPKGPVESQVIQAVADFEWKLNKANVYEAGIMANGRRENEHMLWEENDPKPEFRFVIIEGVVQQTYTKALTNLSMQVSRAQRDMLKRIAQFEKMRAEREIVEVTQRNIAMDSITIRPDGTSGPKHASVGSVFSWEYLMQRLEFVKSCGRDNLAVFDRTWRYKSAPIFAPAGQRP